MKRLARAKRRDANEPDIVNALKAVGCYVKRLDEPCDLLVAKGDRCWLLEVKTATGKLTEAEAKFKDVYPADNYHIVRNIADALGIVYETWRMEYRP